MVSSTTTLYMLLLFVYVSAVESLDGFENTANADSLKVKPGIHSFLPRSARSWSLIKPRLGKRTFEDSEGFIQTDSPWDTVHSIDDKDYADVVLVREGRADMNDAWYPFFTPRPGRRVSFPSYNQ